MKKTLLMTTALVGSLLVATSAQAGGSAYGSEADAKAAPVNGYASASGLGVSVGGFMDFQAGFADQDVNAGPHSRDVKFQNDTEVQIKAEGKSDNGLVYGAIIEMEADVSRDADNEGVNSDRTFIYLESGFGRVELGANTGAEQTLKVDASNIARATGGIDGDWYDFAATGYNPFTGSTVGNSPFIIRPDLPLEHGRGVSEDATKITYYTPRFSGFQAGASYTPDSGNGGTAAGFTSDADAGQFGDVFSLAGNYQGEFNGVSVELAATGTFGQAEQAAFEDLAAWNVGGSVGYQGFSLAGSYGDWGDSGQLAAVNSDADYWTVGAAYETGPFGASVTYLDSTLASNDAQNLVLGADYQLAPGLVPYVEVSFFELDGAGAALDNDGSVVLVGTQLNF
jgi:outer membrane protein OmpU